MWNRLAAVVENRRRRRIHWTSVCYLLTLLSAYRYPLATAADFGTTVFPGDQVCTYTIIEYR